MKKNIFIARSRFNCTVGQLFDWHERNGAFERLSPPWVHVKCVERSGGIRDGSRVVLLLEKGPVRMPWVLGHREFETGKRFVDYQIAGPFDLWQQSHEFEADGPSDSYLTDRVEFQLPLGFAGKLVGTAFIRNELSRLFRYRHSLLARDMGMFRRYAAKPMKILISGVTGLVGTQLKALFETQGHTVISLLRRQSSPAVAGDVVYWDPEAGTTESPLPEDLDAIVHLAGRNVAASRWTVEEKHLIHESRVKGTQYIVQLMDLMKRPPKVFVCASAIGFYGERGSEPLTEDSSAGASFLSEVCHDWEEAALKAKSPSLRVVLARIGAVLSPKGGALSKLLPVFSAGGGGRVGSGNQYFSWVSLDDVLGAIYHAIVTEQVEGPLNVVAPNCVTNSEFTKALSRVLVRPAVFPVPIGALRLAFGEMADALLLSSCRVLPQKLKQSEYEFLDPDLEDALRFMLGLSAGHK